MQAHTWIIKAQRAFKEFKFFHQMNIDQCKEFMNWLNAEKRKAHHASCVWEDKGNSYKMMITHTRYNAFVDIQQKFLKILNGESVPQGDEP